MPEDRFSRHVHLEAGGLHGWCVYCPTESRHEDLKKAVRADGYATVVRRLNYLHNVSYRQNPQLARVAREDEDWLDTMHSRRGPYVLKVSRMNGTLYAYESYNSFDERRKAAIEWGTKGYRVSAVAGKGTR